MANKSFGTKQLDLTGASGSPIITSPSDLSINATTVAISTNISVGGYFASNVNVGAGYSVGIGTTIPTAAIEVRGDIRLRRTTSDDGGIFFGATDNNFIFGSDTDDLLTFATNGSEKFRITTEGNIGINTSSPNIGGLNADARVLTLSGPKRGIIELRGEISSADSIGGIRFLRQDSVEAEILSSTDDGTNGNLRFETNGSEGLRITNSGRVGIMETSPQSPLQVKGGIRSAQTPENGHIDLKHDGTNGSLTSTYGNFLLYSQAGDFIFHTTDSNTEKVRIGSTGNVGIGTDDPITLLDVVGPSVIANLRSTNNDYVLQMQGNNATNKVFFGTTNANDFLLANESGGAGVEERLRIDAKGQITSKGTTSEFDGTGDINGLQMYYETDSGQTSIGSYSASGSTSLCFYTNKNGAAAEKRMTIDFDGNIGAPTGTNIYSASDSRLKKNVVTLDKGLSEINSLRPVSFNWIDGYCVEETDILYGFLAQEVETVDSNLTEKFASGSIEVGETKIEDVLRVKEKQVIPLLVKAVQELSAKNDALEARIAALEG